METIFTMHRLLFFCLLFSSISTISQSNTEIFLFDTSYDSGVLKLLNPKNISNNEGYDNQPSFINDNAILFSSTRDDQTDIVEYRANYDSKTWLCSTEGGEYTPLKIPNSKKISAVRLDKDGKQRLYVYSLKNTKNTELIKDLVVAYYMWYDKNTIVSAAIEDNDLNLYTTNLKDGSSKKYQSKVGRSFHKIPNSELVSYISKEDPDNWQIKSIDLTTGVTKFIANTIPGVEDICWLLDETILSGKDNSLYLLNTKNGADWKEIINLKSLGINKITRITSNTISSKLLIVADLGKIQTTSSGDINSNKDSSTTTNNNAGAIVQRHIEPYNLGNLDDFTNAFTENIVVNKFPNEKIYEGRQTLKQNYERFFKKNKNLSVKVNNRIILNDYVIDEEITTVNNGNGRQVTVYTTNNEGIKTMTFIRNSNVKTNPEIIVNKQLEAYNKRDINAFIATYSKDIKLYNYPNDLRTEGHAAIRKDYLSWFEQTKDLRAVIQKRIVIGNKVIDLEQITANSQTFNAIAIYEVENGLIKKVTFLR